MLIFTVRAAKDGFFPRCFFVRVVFTSLTESFTGLPKRNAEKTSFKIWRFEINRLPLHPLLKRKSIQVL